jgi:nucleotide-binding universal stress UspA family protein
MKRILFPTDFSETSKNAFVYAMHLAQSLEAELIVLHVYDLPNLNVGRMANSMQMVYDSIELENFENLKDEIPLLRQIAEENGLGELKISTILKKGDLVWAVRDTIKNEKIDILVMGTKGASGLKEVFLGSNTGAVGCLPTSAQEFLFFASVSVSASVWANGGLLRLTLLTDCLRLFTDCLRPSLFVRYSCMY